MNNPDKFENRFKTESLLTQKIALSFFPLEIQDFSFTVFRCPFKQGDKMENYFGCSRRKLPKKERDEEQKFGDYWVSYESKEGFEEFVCQSRENPYLTDDILYFALLDVCKRNLIPEKEYFINPSFRKKIVYFSLEAFPEGKRTVWLEPFFLKSERMFGFLADFKFISLRGTKATRYIQQLSLSLDKDGRSNKNFYLDRFDQLRNFIQKYYEKIFPINIGSSSLFMEKTMLNMDVARLNSKQYIFSNGKISNSQFKGIKSYGPLSQIADNPKVYFLFTRENKPFADDLFKALRGDTYNNTFPGMEEMFKFKFDKENVGGKEIEGYDVENLEETIDEITKDADTRRVVPILLFPYKKDFGPESSRMYHLAKYVFLRKKIPSQFVSLVQLRLRDQLKWTVSNIGLALFAKMGGKPWKVSPSTDNSLIIGLGQAHKKENDKISKYYAYSVLTESTGIYKDLKILGQGTDKNSYLTEFKTNLEGIFDQYYSAYNTFVIHSTFSIPHDELNVVEELLEKYRVEKSSNKKFVMMKFNDKNKYFGYSLTSNSMIPYESSYIQLSLNEYLVWFEGLQYHNPNILKKIERPLHIEFLYPRDGLEKLEKISYIQDALNISGANWRGFNAKSLPVSVYYAYLVAEYYKEFQSLGLDDIDLENINPWFL
jgi:hypothetical protein